MSNYIPVPEFIKGAKGAGWKVTDSRGTGARMQPGILHVPLDMECPTCGEAHSHAIRNHEITHAHITLDKHGRMPVLPPGLKLEYFQSVEDWRIWQHIFEADGEMRGEFWRTDDEGLRYLRDEYGEYVPHQPPALCRGERVKWEAVYKGLDDKGRVLFAMAGGPSDEAFIRSIVEKATPPEATLDAEAILRIVNTAKNMLRHDRSILGTYKAAAWLQRMLEPPEERPDDPDPNAGSDPKDAEKADEREENGEGEGPREATEEEAEREKEKHENYARGRDEGSTGWCEVNFEEPVLGRHLPGRLTARYQSADEGAFIRRPDRLYVDQKIFGKKKRIQGGAVLIDDSGSMGLGLDEIMEILETCPGATIGVYSAAGHTGTLRVVARDGRVIDDERLAHTPGGGNGIDGPALEWLASLPFPRKVWISDGWATGNGDLSTENLVLECQILCKKHNIIQVDPNELGREAMASATVNALQGRQLLARKGA